ncbi:MAG: sugar transferase [Rhodospirillales bacterium]
MTEPITKNMHLDSEITEPMGFPFQVIVAPWYVRIVEIIIANVAIILLSPIMLIEAIIIRLDTPGPALFFQPRLGRGAKTFRFIKFRTLYADAKQRFPEMYAYDYSRSELENLCFKVKKDPRVTPAGRWLRKSTLDELPNFFCLLTGDLALVGPRPEIPEMLKYYEGDMLQKFQVRPGITGLAQVSGRGRLGFHETVDIDVDYVNRRSFMLDCKIIFLTVRGILLRDGAF